MNLAKKSLKDCEIVNQWANMIALRRLMMKDEGLYMDEVFLVATIYRLVLNTGKPVKKSDLVKGFNILSYKRDKMLTRLLGMGFINNDRQGPAMRCNGFRLIVSPLGEQLLIKYEKAMRRLCEGDK